MASPGNQQCANCIGTLSFPMAVIRSSWWCSHTLPRWMKLLLAHEGQTDIGDARREYVISDTPGSSTGGKV